MQLAPENAMVFNELAILYRRLGRFVDARAIQRRLVELDPQHLPHQLNLASLSQQLGDFDSAERDLKQVVEQHPDLAVGYTSLARVYLQTGKASQARTFAEAALRRQAHGSAETATTYLVLAAACQQLGDLGEAQDAFEKARQLAPDTPAILGSP
jgi:Flp pilus assembly protein TadD